MPKEIKQQSTGLNTEGKKTGFKFYEDGSISALCTLCGRWEDSDREKAAKFSTTTGWQERYKCYRCWKRGEKGDFVDGAQFGQAGNLAYFAALKVDKERDYEYLKTLRQEIYDNFTRH